MSRWTDEQLVEYVLGTLPEDDDAALAVEVARDPLLEGRILSLTEALCGLVDELAPQPPSPTVRSRLMGDLDAHHRFEPYAAAVAALLEIDEAAALAMLRGVEEPGNWSPGALPGTLVWPVPTDDEAIGITWLRMPAGSAFPHHEHLGRETVFVLQGQYIDHEGFVHPPGAVLQEPMGSDHWFTIGAQGPEFICLAVLEGGIKVGDVEVTREDLYGV